MGTIEYVFVLMMENRSFDHLFAFSGVAGVNPPPSSFGFQPGATDRLEKDPPHEYENVQSQIANGQMTGFPASGGIDAMRGFLPDDIPNSISLARDYLLMDNWFSSMPGPTWPNRYFAHAASSGGLDNSPPLNVMGDAVYYADHCFEFDNGHIFDRFVLAGKKWRVYRGDRFPQILSLKGMVDAAGIQNGDRFFRWNDSLQGDLHRGDVANYTFIEPYYDPYLSFWRGHSQHPLASVRAGDTFIGYVYNAIRASSVWDRSLLLVTWDEHGGFFDQVTPVEATPPGDSPRNHDRAGSHKRDCKFDRFGVRVPALLVSKWLPKGLGSDVFPDKTFDHSSIVASLRWHFDLGPPLTKRAAAAPTWTAALLDQARTDVPRPLKMPKFKPQAPKRPPPIKIAAIDDAPGSLGGFAQIALDLDWQVAKQTGKPPLSTSSHRAQLARVQDVLSQGQVAKRQRTNAHHLVVEYMAAVDARVAAYEKAYRRK